MSGRTEAKEARRIVIACAVFGSAKKANAPPSTSATPMSAKSEDCTTFFGLAVLLSFCVEMRIPMWDAVQNEMACESQGN